MPNALSIDVEDYFHVSAMARSIDREDWESLPSRVEQNTDRLLGIFGEAGVGATFFVLGWVAERFPSLIRRIHAAGHEVACHGLTHRQIFRQTPDEFRSETERSKAILEDAIGEAVSGYRAASFSITNESLWALDILHDAGFTYDSSVFPVRHDLYGLPEAPRFPFRWRIADGRTLLEFPPSTCQIAGVNVPASGGGYFRIYPYALTRYLIRSLNRKEGKPAMFYLHPWEVDPDQPRIRTSARSRFRHYHNLAKCEGRLRRLLRDFRFDPVRNVLSRVGPEIETFAVS